MDYCIYNEQTGDKAEVRLPEEHQQPVADD